MLFPPDEVAAFLNVQKNKRLKPLSCMSGEFMQPFLVENDQLNEAEETTGSRFPIGEEVAKLGSAIIGFTWTSWSWEY